MGQLVILKCNITNTSWSVYMCFFLSLSLQEEEAYPIEFIEINIPQGFWISPLNTVLYTFSN